MSASAPTVSLERVTRRFGRVVAVDGVSFELRPGEVLGLLGPNGAGKTTTMRMLTGFLRPTGGRVLYDGVDLWDAPVEHKHLLGYVPESSALYPEMSVEAYLTYWGRLRGLSRTERTPAVRQVVETAGLARHSKRTIGALSKGLRRRVALAQALMHDPPILVLDEPTEGLDPRQTRETRDLIGQLGRTRTVLLSSHLLSEVQALCRRVVVLDRGRVVAEDEVSRLTESGTLEDAYLSLVRDA